MNSRTFTVCQASAGSGKTYTLAATYVTLLLGGESYRTILAVTFTNKATAEMKERILLFLDNIARNTGADAAGALETVKKYIVERGLVKTMPSDDELRRRAEDCYKRMLEDYDNIHISTIDTFLMQLLGGLGQMLDDNSATAAVELDIDALIADAVDRLMTFPDEAQKGLRARIEAYVNEQLDSEKNWDIRGQLRAIAAKLYSEAAQQLDAEGKIVFDPERIRSFKQRNDYRKMKCVIEATRIYNDWKDRLPESWMEKWFERIDKSIKGEIKADDAFRGPTEKQLNKPMPDELRQLVDLCVESKRAYLTYKFSSELLNDLSLMSDIRESIHAIMAEQNIILLAQTAQVLHAALKQGDADFILEKAGIRYRHIMLDEFQDTSVLQWSNFRPLLEEILAGGGSVFIVGDVKQSIYRWRNGDWRIMANLKNDQGQLANFYNELPLSRNFRSEKEIMHFNLDLFNRLGMQVYLDDEKDTEHPDLSRYYRSGHEGGYVRVRAIEDKEACVADMFLTIEQRLAAGYKGSDMLILARTHAEIESIIGIYRSLIDSGNYPLLEQVGLVSCDSFKLDSSPLVCRVIDLIKYITKGDAVSEYALRIAVPNLDIATLRNTLPPSMPLIEMIEEVAKIILSAETVTPDDSAYLSGLMDEALNYTIRYGADVEAFLEAWDENIHKQPVAAPICDSVKIMTIHVAKGLEAKQVYIPFCNWKMENASKTTIWCRAKQTADGKPDGELEYIPVVLQQSVSDSAYADEYALECEMQQIDNINTLYVALTRAGEELYVYVDTKEADWSKAETAGALIMNVLQDKGLTQKDFGYEYEAGAPMPLKEKGNSAVGGKMIDRCSFNDAEKIEAEWHIGERTPEFRQSTESLNYMLALGSVCHGILEQMKTRDDEARALRQARLDGRITDDDQLKLVTELIDRAWTNDSMCDWFSGRWELLREVAFLDRGREFRPDRVMIDRKSNRAIVLDYKFGEHENSYAKQVKQYMSLLRRRGFSNVEGWIWYAQEGELVEVKEGGA
ncbi:MAG: UvrD-helicase domain-containing protein [Paludibacteraceae bacterium]|nr:UvrD-helicase domain-containing protein [Paludibacteraceae bacterium]